MLSTSVYVILALNAATYLIYYYDKAAARQGAWRISESTLFLLAILGGAPAAITAMLSLRHKTRKPSFRYGLPLILALQAFAFAYWRNAGAPNLISELS